MLTDSQIRYAKPTDRPRKIFDERGLYLLVAAHRFAPCLPAQAFGASLAIERSRAPRGACSPALRRLPGRDSHPLKRCSMNPPARRLPPSFGCVQVLCLQVFRHFWRQCEALANAPSFQPLEQQLERRPVHLARVDAAPVTDEPTGLEPLRPDAKSRCGRSTGTSAVWRAGSRSHRALHRTARGPSRGAPAPATRHS